MIVIVTQELRTSLIEAHNLLSLFDNPSTPPGDKPTYPQTVAQLDRLVQAVIACQLGSYLVIPTGGGARVDYDPGTLLAKSTNDAAEYLGAEAAFLLRDGGSDPGHYTPGQVSLAVSFVRGLYQAVHSAILSQADADLLALLTRDIVKFMATAEYIGDVLASP